MTYNHLNEQMLMKALIQMIIKIVKLIERLGLDQSQQCPRQGDVLMYSSTRCNLLNQF